MLAFYSDYYEVKAMRAPRVPVEEQYRLIMECRKSGLSDHQWCLNNDINPGTFYNWVMRLRKNSCGDIPEKNQLSTYEQSHQEVVKIEMNSISVPTEINKNTDTAAMELMIGNMNLRISNETDRFLPKQSRYLRSFHARRYTSCRRALYCDWVYRYEKVNRRTVCNR